MCTRIYHWHYHPLLNAIGTLQGRGRDGSNFLETAKMWHLSPSASLPDALCVGGSVFILFAKRCADGKMENEGAYGGGHRYRQRIVWRGSHESHLKTHFQRQLYLM